MADHIVDPELKKFATTPKQIAYIDAVNATGGYRAAARSLGLKSQSNDSVRQVLRSLEISAAARGYKPNSKRTPIPLPFVAKGYSTLRDKDGNVVMEWEKTKLDDQLRAAAIMAAFENAAVPLPRLAPLPRPKHTLKDLLNLYTFTDYHLGMRASAKESGKDWGLAKAEQNLIDTFEYMIENSPKAEVGFINQLGDFLHSDSLLPVTPTSGHVVDQDVGYAQMVEAAVRVLRRLVDLALIRHDRVVVLMAEGNHDLASSVWLRVLFRTLYENEPRVTVIDSDQPFYAYQWGKTMLGFHHGHKVKNEQLPALFAARFREMWGAVKKVYIHCGHRHHVEEKELSGAKIIQHPTLAAADAHSSRNGYDSECEASVIVYHQGFGQSGRVTVTPEMLEAA